MMRYLRKAGRDNARTPMQWSDEAYAGFSSHTPWIMVNPNYLTINVKQQQEDEDSILHYYQGLLSFRKQHDVIYDGIYQEYMEESNQVYMYERSNALETQLIVCNFSKEKQAFDTGIGKNFKKVFGNYEDSRWGSLQAYECIVYAKCLQTRSL